MRKLLLLLAVTACSSVDAATAPLASHDAVKLPGCTLSATVTKTTKTESINVTLTAYASPCPTQSDTWTGSDGVVWTVRRP